MLRDLDSVASNLSYWANVETLYLRTDISDASNKFTDLEADLIKLYAAVLELEVELVDTVSDGFAARVVMNHIRTVSWKDQIRDISTYHTNAKNTFDRCKIAVDQHGKVKKWISDYRPETAHNDALERTGVDQKYRTCGQWLLNTPQFKDWSSAEPTSDSRFLWLRGTTGTGKSTLLTRITQWHLDRASLYPGHRLAYFYCSRGADRNSKHSYQSVLRALLRQAAYDPVNGRISTQLLHTYKNAGGDSEDLQPLSFAACNELLHEIVRSGVKLRIIIDALDECDAPKTLLKALKDASEVIPGGLEVLVSSRHEVHVDEKIPNVVIINLTKSSSETDMITYIQTEVNERDDDERLLKGKHPDLETRLIEILGRRAGGMFIWVQLQLSFFLNRKTPFVRRDTVEKYLDQLNTSSVADEKDLSIAYNDIFERNTSENDLERIHASKIYKIVLCSICPLSITTIVVAVAFRENGVVTDKTVDAQYIRELTRDFLVETRDETLEFAHVSVKDYLQGEHRSEYSNTKCHAQLALTCLQYTYSCEWAIYKASMAHDAFLWYASRYWGEHCIQLSKEDRQTLGISDQLINWLLKGSGSTTFQNWLRGDPRFNEILRIDKTYPLYLASFCCSDSGSPVFAAAIWNLVEILQELLSVGRASDMILTSEELDLTPLSLASWRGNEAAVELLLTIEEVDVNSRDSFGQTPLSYAAANGNQAVVKLLLATEGVDVNSIDDNSHTPLSYAAANGHQAVVRLLLATEGVDVNLTDDNGQSPLLLAAKKRHTAVVELLLETDDIDVNLQDTRDRTALLLATHEGCSAVVKLLLAAEKIDVNLKEATLNFTPLSLAAWRGDEAIVGLLLASGKADVNSVDNCDRTPLSFAAEYGCDTVVELLLETEGIGVDLACKAGHTPQFYAMMKGHEAIVQRLLATGKVDNALKNHVRPP
ncbi:Ankyrin repeat-containing protein [Penicillium macrosclerotiorum]|uniref:Ankyrin repeat-containing protein n=1 Tax=Penicillium macrosclerotiorum TaxID=303699 RepID=UPI00254985A4|nr:Ankyrin repeat-containing protein [Penicillium macrosclerotiorum]KAJ5678666.1 Ankyrin repeat-containing protein [Penicillium macrosclerotiorum]